jgi:hypothetical protein
MYPFLSLKSFEEIASSPQLEFILETELQWSALYYTILALGCQHEEGRIFDVGTGKAWEIFRIALSLAPRLLLPMTGLTGVQVRIGSSPYHPTRR